MSALPCGIEGEDLLEQVAEDRTPDAETAAHQHGCRHCRAALEEYRRVWSPVQDLAHQEVRAPSAVIERALARVRTLVDDPTAGLLDDAASGPGSTRIAARVVVVCAREAAERIEGVRGALGRVGEVDERVGVGLTGATAVVELTLAASYGQDLQALGRRVRRDVEREVRSLTGLTVVSVSVHVDDILTDPSARES